jgi:MoaA/NifB/PqqE/SkfB family radical SAM enzyme
MTMVDLSAVLSVVNFIGVCVFLAMEWNQSKTIKQMQNDIYNNYDATTRKLYELEDNYNRRLRNTQTACENTAQWRNELMKKKYDELTNCHSATETRLSELASRVWIMEGNVESLQPYIKRIHLKKLAKTAGDIHKNSLKEIKEIENELK